MRLFGFDFHPFRSTRAPERRSDQGGADAVDPASLTWGLYRDWLGGISVSREKAMAIPAVWAAVNVFSGALASLPFDLFERTPAGASPADGHPVANLLRLEPSEHYSSFEFRRAMFAQACFGNAYALIHRNGIGRPVELEILDPLSVEPFQMDSGKRVYIVNHRIGSTQRRLVVTPRDMIHLRAISLDGINGLQTATVHRDVHAGGIAAQEYSNYYFSNGAHVGGALVYPGMLTKEQRTVAEKKLLDKNGGVRNVGKTLLLDGGVKYEKFSQNPEEAGLNNYRNMVVYDEARIFGVPAHLIAQMDRATFNNIETMNVQFVTLCLRPWCVQAEQEFTRKLLTESEKTSGRYFVRFNLDGLLRGDTKSRAEYYRMALGGPGSGDAWLTPEEVRQLENFNSEPTDGELFKVTVAQDPPADPAAPANTPDPAPQNDSPNGSPQASK